MAAKAWQDRLVSGLFLCTARWLARRDLAAVHRFGERLGALLNVVPNEARTITERNLSWVNPQLEQPVTSREALIELGKTAAEFGPMWQWDAARMAPLIVDIQGQAHMDAALAAGKGVLLLAPHLGNWELLGWYLGRHYPTTSMYEPPYFSGIDGFMRAGRERSGATLVPTDVTGVRALLRALKHNQVAAILPDQAPDSGYVFADFFGRPARTMTLAHKLVQRSGASTIMAFMERLPDAQGYRLHYLPGPDLTHDKPHIAARALNEAVERCVQIAPAQYQWSYKRWRKPPADMSDLYATLA